MTKVRLSLSVSEPYMNKIDEVAAAAKRAGLKIEQSLNDLGVLTGVIDQDKIGRLHRLDGVSDVEEERIVSIPSPDDPVQ